ncbi:hypothetical protein IW142_004015 [Coemansia sp. RSA 564]|nr:hypothetical protein IW142_004015 [Coemansia sp. RSA 564]
MFLICDQTSAGFDDCNVTLDGSYSYATLGFKNHDTLQHMCQSKLFDMYDMFVKVDDDVLYDPDHLSDVISRMDIAEHAMLGFLLLDNSNVVWPNGPIYAYSASVLRWLCSNETALNRTRGTHEDVRFGHALALNPQVQYYNADDVFNPVYHLQYRSSRMFVQFMQYGTCKNVED